MKAYLAEFIGTFILVFIGLSSIVFLGHEIGALGIGLAFGTVLVALIHMFGPISGAHFNPSVSLAAVICKRMHARTALMYVAMQIPGAILAAGLVYVVAIHHPIGPGSMGAHTFEASAISAVFLFETVATFIFVLIILGVTGPRADTAFAPLAIGLVLVAMYYAGIGISGPSMNFARTLRPALFSGGQAIDQLWLYALAPTLGAALAGIVDRVGLFRA